MMDKRDEKGRFVKGRKAPKTAFSKTNPPKNPGRKPSRFKQLVAQLEEMGNEPITKSDYENIVSRLLTLTPVEIKKITEDKQTPIAVIIIASAIAGDIDSRNIANTEKLTDRIFGKEPEKHEHSGLVINYVNHAKG